MTVKEQVAVFIEIYSGTDEDVRVFEAPGRINLIGEHIDYNGGHVFPAALTFKNVVVARKNGTNTINMAVSSLPNRVSADIDKLQDYKGLEWGNYQTGVAHVLKEAGYNIVGCDLYYHGTVPYGAGLSSSASIEIATALALAKLGGHEELVMTKIAVLCQKAENTYVGMNCGIMDQYISAVGKKDHAILLNTSTLVYEYVPMDLGDYIIVITNTNAPHKLTESQYNTRRTQCEEALEVINKNGGNYNYLCQLDIDTLEKFIPYFDVEDVRYHRARHCVTEEARTLKAVDMLKKGDIEAFGQLLNIANASMRDDYDATGVELDTVFDIAVNIEGVIGSRMTGGGFGGCNISIVHKDKAQAFEKTMIDQYTKQMGYAPTCYRTLVGNGGTELKNWR